MAEGINKAGQGFSGSLALVANWVIAEKYFLTRYSGKRGVYNRPLRMHPENLWRLWGLFLALSRNAAILWHLGVTKKNKSSRRVIRFRSRWRSSSRIYSYTSLIRVESFLWVQSELQWTLWTACCLRICGISLNNTENTTWWVLCLKGKKTVFRKRNKKSVFTTL